MQKEGRDPVDFRIATIARNQLLIAVEETDPLRDVVDCRLETQRLPFERRNRPPPTLFLSDLLITHSPPET